MKTKKMRKGAIAVLGAVLACCVSAAGAGFAGGFPALAMNTASNTDVISGDLWDSTANGISQAPLQTLVSKIAGGKTSYTDLLSAVQGSANGAISASQLRTANSNKDLVVTLGEKKWTVTYVSQDLSGNVIASLWYTDSDITGNISNTWRSDMANGSYAGYTKLSNHYGGSYARAVTLGNGGQYYTAASATVTTDSAVSTVNATVAQAQASAFYDFAQGDISKYLVAPYLVDWQQEQYNGGNRDLNETLVEVTDHWFNDNIKNSQSDPLYFQWGRDKVWLPSAVETSSLWGTSVNQNSNTDSGGSWLRTGYGDSAYGGRCLRPDGTVAGAGNTTNVMAIRPAIHLNLTKAFKDADGEYFTQRNSELADAWNAAVEESLFNAGKQVTFTLTDNWYALADDTYTTSFGTGTGFNAGRIYVPLGADIVLDLNGYRIDRSLPDLTNNGQTIYVAGTLTINDSSGNDRGLITGACNYTDNGGGVLVGANGRLTFNGGTVSGNRTNYGGAGIMSHAPLIINGGIIENNHAPTSATGGIINSGYFEMNGGIIRNNDSASGAGGLYFAFDGTFYINGGEIYGNQVTGTASNASGGGIYIRAGKLTINDVKIHDNLALSGGGIWMTSYNGAAPEVIINGGGISDNTVNQYGGGIYMSATGGKLTINGGLISGNKSIDKVNAQGGGICVYGGEAIINGGEISGNEITRGGAIFTNGTNTVLTMNGGVIKNNTASHYGGGFYVNAHSTFTMNGGEIINNTATGDAPNSGDWGYGGGVFVNSGDSTFNLNGGVITGNKASKSGGGVVVYQSGAIINLKGGIVNGNTLLDGTTKSNVYLHSASHFINILGNLGAGYGTSIGVSVNSSKTGAFTIGYLDYNTGVSGGTYFFADNGNGVVSATYNGKTEIGIGTTAITAPTNLTWRYTHNGATTNIAVTERYVNVPFTGNAYTVSLASGTITKAVDANGRPVTAMVDAGVYNFTAGSTSVYANNILTFEILPADISGATVSVAGGSVYNGKAHTPEVKVELGGVTLTKDKDYTVEYAQNVNAGNAKVAVYGAGNYGGTAFGTFEIEKRNIEIRWNKLEAEYDGAAKGAVAYAEGLVEGESLSVVLVYELNGHSVTPVNAETYTVHALLRANDNYKLAPNAQISETFIIKPKTVEAVWSALSFVYNGNAQAPEATYTDISGNSLPLTVTVNGAHVNADTYTATATTGNSNYVVSAATANMRFTIAKKAVAPVVGADNNPYDGKAFIPEITVVDLNGGELTLTYEYFADGASLGTSAPVNAGKYVVRVTLGEDNYALAGSDGKEIAYYDFEYTITPSQAEGSWTFADNVYNGSGKAPEFTYTDAAETLGFTVTYGKDKGDGTAEEYTEDKPVNAGDYVAKIVFENGNYVEALHTFTIAKKTVAVSWSGDELSVIGSGNSYRWLFDGSEHAPVATAVSDGEELELTVAGQTNAGSYTATAVLEDNEVNKNYTLSGNTHAYSIVQSTVTAVKWYEYGASNPVADGAKLSYQYISVYGWDGPKLSAYGVATMQGQGTDGGTVTRTVEVPLTVTYQGNINTTGYWTIDNYTAVAAIKTADRNGNCTTSLTATDMSIGFAVTEKQLETTVATIVWVFDTEAVEDADSGVYYWIYDGKAHAPEARRIDPDKTYDPDDRNTYEVLPVGGNKTDAGRYYAYILPSCGYDIDDADADCLFEIRPREITVAWSGVGGAGNNFDWTYDGQSHAPVARVVSGAGGLTVTLEAIAEYTDVGNYVAYARTNANFIIKEDGTSSATQNFSIKQLVLDPDGIVWTGKDGSETDFTWIYDGNAYAPSATLEVEINGETVKIALKVSGEASAVGDHTAYAMLDSTVAVNANFVLKGASCGFKIENGAIAKIEWEGAENGENLEFVYDGKVHTPKAYYWLDGEKVYLNVIGGAADAGEYIAYVTDYTGVTAGMSHAFTVKPAELTVTWSQTSVEFDQAAHSPAASFADGEGNAVALNLGKDYAVSSFSTAGTYTAEITFLNGNYTYAGNTGSVEFTITPKKIFISWTAQDDGTFNFEYNGKAQKPAFTYTESGVTVTVTGAETAVGTYVAVATVDDGNYCLYDSLHTDKAEREFAIVPFAITVDWKGEDGSETDFTWEYSGAYVAPTATYKDWNGDEQTLTVRGERMDAGEYTATAVLPQNCSFKFTSGENAGTHAFTVSPKLIKDIVWEGEDGSETDFEWVYTGKVITPVAKTADGDILAVIGGAADAGDYVASAVLPNTQNYKFDDNVGGTQKFKITEKTVDVLWYGKDDSLTDFTWDYTGSIIRPVAKFVDVDGNYVEVPVNGGASSAGQHTATAADVFTNYVFSEISSTQVFIIKEKSLTITWSDGDKLADGVYTYEYNGKAQMPIATADEDINLSYTVKNAAGETVGSVIGAGEYTVTISPANKNYVIDGESAAVKVKITPKTVEVQWQKNLDLLYTGSEVAPEAWFIDAENQAVALKVTGAKVEAGEGYEATAGFITPNANYVLKEDTVTKQFNVVKNTDDLVWDWENGEWKKPEPSTEPDGGNDGDGEDDTTPAA